MRGQSGGGDDGGGVRGVAGFAGICSGGGGGCRSGFVCCVFSVFGSVAFEFRLRVDANVPWSQPRPFPQSLPRADRCLCASFALLTDLLRRLGPLFHVFCAFFDDFGSDGPVFEEGVGRGDAEGWEGGTEERDEGQADVVAEG